MGLTIQQIELINDIDLCGSLPEVSGSIYIYIYVMLTIVENLSSFLNHCMHGSHDVEYKCFIGEYVFLLFCRTHLRR